MVGAAMLVLLLAPAPPPAAHAQAPCRFVLGFAAIRAAIGPERVGDCLEDEHANPANGDALQRTTGGLLVWRKADNWTAFTDGHRTWLNGPLGLQQRLNSERFDWEAPAVPGPVGPESAAPAALPEAVAQGARAAAARRLTVVPEALTVARVESVDWSDTSLGCPQPGFAYAQVITPGYRLIVRAAAREVEVHADEAGRAVIYP